MYIINESKIKTLKHTFKSQLSGLMFKDVSQRELKSLKQILDRNKIIYDVIKDLNRYQVITDLEEDELNTFIELAKQFKSETGHTSHTIYMNRQENSATEDR